MKFTSTEIIELPVEKINLTEWLFRMGDKDYQQCSQSHIAMGITPDGSLGGAINVERIGSVLMIQHYHTVHKERHKVTLVSENSDALIFHFIPIKVYVKWEMKVTKDLKGVTFFHCTVTAIYPNKLLEILGTMIGAPYFLKKHTIEETKGFARSIHARYV